MSYQNFDLSSRRPRPADSERESWAPQGEGQSTDFALPFDNAAGEPSSGVTRTGSARGGAAPTRQAEASRILGSGLFDSVFAQDIRLAWSRSDELARAQGDGLRLRLRLACAPSIAGLPWELLYDAEATVTSASLSAAR